MENMGFTCPHSAIYWKQLWSDNEEDWNEYITALEQLPSDIKVLGINDYLFIDGYKKVKEYKK